MPFYDYYCEENNKTVEVLHPSDITLEFWGELCFVAQIPLEDIHPETPIKKLIGHVNIGSSLGNSELKNAGFVKLKRRDDGVLENMTCLDNESRYFRADDPQSQPDLSSRIGD